MWGAGLAELELSLDCVAPVVTRVSLPKSSPATVIDWVQPPCDPARLLNLHLGVNYLDLLLDHPIL